MFNFDKIEDKFLELRIIKDTRLEEIYFSLCRFKNKMQDLFWYSPKNFILNFWKYKEFLWTDRWYDFYFIFNMLKIKLEQDAIRYEKYGTSVDSKKYAKYMKYCANLIKKINEDEYDNFYLEPYYKKWGNEKWDDIIDYNHKKDSPEKTEHFKKCMELSEREREKDKKHLFTFLNDNIFYWWD